MKLPPDHYNVARHIVSEKHCKLLAEGVAGDERAIQAENSNPNNDGMQDVSDGGKKSATSNENTPTETADGDGDSGNALPVQDGLLVVNGFDVVKYIRGLEGRISELEAANAVP